MERSAGKSTNVTREFNWWRTRLSPVQRHLLPKAPTRLSTKWRRSWFREKLVFIDDGGNRDSAFDLPLPVHLADPLERLRAVHELTSCRQDAADAQQLDALLHRLSEVSPSLRRVADRLRATAREVA